MLKTFKELFNEAIKLRRFPKGIKTRTVNVEKDVIERAHAAASNLTGPNGRLPYVKIIHNPKDKTYEIHTRRRDRNGSPIEPAVVVKHDEGSFIQRTNELLSSSHQDFYPRATHVQMQTDGKKFRFTLGRQ